jgi:predicted Zn finger-like uncharacterized protein
MNIACTACSARYGVADDKLIGKRVRITCKRCGTVLIVDGNTNPPTVSASSSIAPSRPASSRSPAEVRSPPPPVAEPPFTVLNADGQQEQADIAQIVRLYRSGQLGSDSLVWREGMPEWSDPWNVAEIAAAFRRMGYTRPTPVPAAPAARQSLDETYDDEATQVVESNPQHEPPRYEDAEPPTNVVDASRLGSEPPIDEPRAASRPVAEDDEGPTYVARNPGSTNLNTAAREAQRARRASSRPPREGVRWSEPGRAATREPGPRAQEPAPRAQEPASRAQESASRARVSAPPPSSRASSRPPAARASSQPPAARAPSQPPAARSRSTRPREDLFARQAHAGSEEEQQADAVGAAGYDLDAPRLTGARNETSVLFSLDSLIKKEPPAPRQAPRARRDESLLVDSGNSLPVGGGFAPALSAPDFTAPVSASPPPAPSLPSAPYPYDDAAARSSRAWLYVVVLLAVLAGGVIAWRTGALPSVLAKAGLVTPPPVAVAVPPAPSALHPAGAAEPGATASASASAAASATAAASESATAAASAPSSSPSAAKAEPTTQAAAARTPATTRAAGTGASSPARESSARESTARESAAKESSKETAAKDTSAKEAATSTPAPAAASGPFDTAAAKEALTSTAGNAASCKEMGGPTGNGKVSITFAPSGRPTSVAVTGDLAGTTVGSCVARLFRSVKVPAFSGDPVTVAKSFSIE